MSSDLDAAFDHFASAFVKAYWSAVRDRTVPMPPDEPVEQSLEELLSSVSYVTELKAHRNQKESQYTIRMTGAMEDWWLFGFRNRGGTWKLMSASARSDKKNSSHDLLGEVYEPYFRRMLEHATTKANEDSEQGTPPNRA